MPDITIECKTCRNEFIFTENEQGYYFQRNLVRPKRCRKCRKTLSRGELPRRSEKQSENVKKDIPIYSEKMSSLHTAFGERTVVYDGQDWFIDQERIQEFVDAVEAKKGFKPHYEKIFRHMVSEIGELDGAIYKWEQSRMMKDLAPKWDDVFIKSTVGTELVDLISLCVYMATVMGIDLNEIFPARMRAVAEQYGVGNA